MPKRVKYRKPHSHPRIKGPAKKGTTIAFGEYGLKALEPWWVTARQIEAARVSIGRNLKKGGKLWLRIFPDKAITKHPAETRMGKGKGAPDHWAAVIRPGRILFEVQGISREEAAAALREASFKLPIRTRFVAREHI
jgi:large subunit ribosomal protein L16